MTHSAQGSFDMHQLFQRWGRIVLTSIFVAGGLLATVQVVAQESNPLVIRGPQGSEQLDVRRGVERYGPIVATDTLWSIAQQHRPHSSVSVAQMMAAIVQANPEAFRHNNPSEMLTGFYLRIPSLQEIQMVNPEAARRQLALGEELDRQQNILKEQEQLTEQRRQEQDQLVQETRSRTEQAIAEVRSGHEQEFLELRESLLLAITNTENVFRDNEELRERLARLEDLLIAIQTGAVSTADYEAEIAELKEVQQHLRREQDIVRALTEEKSMVEELLDQPAALALLASVPALLMILLTTWLLRRRQLDLSNHALFVESDSPRDDERELSEEEARDALERELMGGLTAEEDDLLSDDPFAGFDDDEGADLDRLSDEMLMPALEPDTAEEDFGIRLDSNDDDLAANDFSELDDDDDHFDGFAELEEVAVAEQAFDELTLEPEAVPEPQGDGSLEQNELDQLLAASAVTAIGAAAISSAAEAKTNEAESVTADELTNDDLDDFLDAFARDDIKDFVAEETASETDGLEKDDELLPEESDLDPFDPDVLLDQELAAQQAEKANTNTNERAPQSQDEELDVDALLTELGLDEADFVNNELNERETDSEMSAADIDALLAATDSSSETSVLAELDSSLDTEPESASEVDLLFGDDEDIDADRALFVEDLSPLVEVDQRLQDEAGIDEDELIDLVQLEEPPVETEESSAEREEIDFNELAAEEELDAALFELDDHELAQAAAEAESELESLFGDVNDTEAEENTVVESYEEKNDTAQVTEAAADFIDIDQLLAETEQELEVESEEAEDDSSRAEDQLAVQLDLARAYLEMGDAESAQEVVREVLAAATDDQRLQNEATELLQRIEQG